MSQIRKWTLPVLIVSFFVCRETAKADSIQDATAIRQAAHASLDASAAWHSEVENLKWSKVTPALDSDARKNWVVDGYEPKPDQVVVKGVTDSRPALERAINEHILPKVERSASIGSAWDRQLARRRIEKELERVDVVVDQFSQTFYRQVGSDEIEVFTREAVLLDLADAKLEPIVRGVRRDLNRGKRFRSEAFGFFGISMSVACLVCVFASRFLNRVTRGYYVWPIRLVTGLAFLSCLGLTAGIAFSILRAI